MSKKFLIKHVGNMGDMIFFIPPVLATLKRKYPGCHITFVTAWGFKEKKWPASRSLSEGWGKRNQDGFCIALMLTNPHIDQLVHWHDTQLSLDGKICVEEGRALPTWNRSYFEQQKQSGQYDSVYELDFGLAYDDNPIQKMYEVMGLPGEDYSHYQLYLTAEDKSVAAAVMASAPRPRIFLLEGLEGTTTRGWDPNKIPVLEAAITKTYGTAPLWFGAKYRPILAGCPLTLRQNIATLALGDVAVGVMSGPLHFAAAVGLPTLTLLADQPLHRVAPAFFLNRYRLPGQRPHRTLLGPSAPPYRILKSPPLELTPAESARQSFIDWQRPGRQATKSAVAVITVDEIMTLLRAMLPA